MRVEAALVCAALAAGAATTAHAGQRQFVASYGNDVNPCTLTQPCRGFAAAVAAVDPGGEVVVLDSAGYGPVTIAKSVSITAPAGIYAGITVPTSQNGVIVNGGTYDVVLRGLTIDGKAVGSIGIKASNAGSLTIERCTIEGFASEGIFVSPASNVVVAIRDTTITRVGSEGIYLAGASGTVERVSVTKVSGSGIYVSTSSVIAVTDVVVAYTQGDGIVGSASGGQTTRMSVTRSTLSNIVGYGIVAAEFGGVSLVHASDNSLSTISNGGLLAQSPGARLVATRNAVSDSPWGLVQNVGGVLVSFGDNPVYGNTAQTTGTISHASWQ